MLYIFIAYFATLVFLFTKLRRLQHSAPFQAAFGLCILVPVAKAVQALGFLGVEYLDAATAAVIALSMLYLGKALFQADK
ncbi:MAG: hypothetical protein QGF46_08165 [Planctomycetota bacterium]|jgi:hypothetical protein|nr:hypothetical protein [Planctomycetota bacterium]